MSTLEITSINTFAMGPDISTGSPFPKSHSGIGLSNIRRTITALDSPSIHLGQPVSPTEQFQDDLFLQGLDSWMSNDETGISEAWDEGEQTVVATFDDGSLAQFRDSTLISSFDDSIDLQNPSNLTILTTGGINSELTITSTNLNDQEITSGHVTQLEQPHSLTVTERPPVNSSVVLNSEDESFPPPLLQEWGGMGTMPQRVSDVVADSEQTGSAFWDRGQSHPFNGSLVPPEEPTAPPTQTIPGALSSTPEFPSSTTEETETLPDAPLEVAPNDNIATDFEISPRLTPESTLVPEVSHPETDPQPSHHSPAAPERQEPQAPVESWSILSDRWNTIPPRNLLLLRPGIFNGSFFERAVERAATALTQLLPPGTEIDIDIDINIEININSPIHPFFRHIPCPPQRESNPPQANH